MRTKKKFLALLIDDNAADQSFFANAIADIPMQCEFADSGAEAPPHAAEWFRPRS